MAAAEIKLSAEKASRGIKVGNIESNEDKDAVSFFKQLSETALMDTGILPLEGTGVLAIRQALNHTQIVFQHEPGSYLVNWGTYEGDPQARTWSLAQPYRIVIGDIVDGNLLGARTFYSPVPVQTADQPLYHVNLPNINCKGYRGNGVGWICLYHTQNWSALHLNDKIRALVERASGVETYNDRNMSSTDGPRFYKAHGKPKYVWDPAEWSSRTAEEGHDWTVTEQGLWIPILVAGPDDQAKHVDGGVPLTLEMAMHGRYAAYYGDQYLPKPVNAFMNPSEKEPDGATIQTHIGNAFAKATAVGQNKKKVIKKVAPVEPEPEANGPVWNPAPAWVPPPVVVKCPCCENVIENADQPDNFVVTQHGKTCKACIDECFEACKTCKNPIHHQFIQTWNDGDNAEFYCVECATVYNCPNCNEKAINDASFIVDSQWCVKCADVGNCQQCDKRTNMAFTHGVTAQVPWADQPMLFQLCIDCVGTSVLCGCGYLKGDQDCAPLGDGTMACEPCIAFKDDDTPFFQPVEITGLKGKFTGEEEVLWANVAEV